MKRRILFVATGLLLAAALCWGYSQGEESVLQDVDPTGVEITYWHQFTRFQQETLEALVEEFNKTNQWNIRVTPEFGGRYDDLYNKMVTAIAAGRVPDLVAAYQNEAAAYQASGALVDINDYIDDPQWGLGEERSDYFEGFLQQDVNAQFGGARLGFPPNRSLELLYYNMDWLERMGFGGPPKNWDEFYRMYRATSSRGGSSDVTSRRGSATMGRNTPTVNGGRSPSVATTTTRLRMPSRARQTSSVACTTGSVTAGEARARRR